MKSQAESISCFLARTLASSPEPSTQRPLPPHIRLHLGKEQLDIAHAEQIEIARNRVFETACCCREIDRRLRRHAANQAVQDACCECISRADPIDDAVQGIRTGGENFA